MIRRAVTFHNTVRTRGTYAADHPVGAREILVHFHEMRLLILKYKRVVIRFTGNWMLCLLPRERLARNSLNRAPSTSGGQCCVWRFNNINSVWNSLKLQQYVCQVSLQCGFSMSSPVHLVCVQLDVKSQATGSPPSVVNFKFLPTNRIQGPCGMWFRSL
jgi:hypothetical protein